jgi:hypothetical protein
MELVSCSSTHSYPRCWVKVNRYLHNPGALFPGETPLRGGGWALRPSECFGGNLVFLNPGGKLTWISQSFTEVPSNCTDWAIKASINEHLILRYGPIYMGLIQWRGAICPLPDLQIYRFSLHAAAQIATESACLQLVARLGRSFENWCCDCSVFWVVNMFHRIGNRQWLAFLLPSAYHVEPLLMNCVRSKFRIILG